MSPIDAFRPVLDWINDDEWTNDRKPGRISPDRARRLLDAFVAAFDGSESSSFIRTEPLSARPTFIPEFQERARPDSDEELEQLHTMLGMTLERAVPLPGAPLPRRESDLQHQFDILEFDVERQEALSAKPRGRRLSKFEKADRKRLRNRPGACVLRVAGRRWDLVRYLVLHLLTMPGAFSLSRCPAPRPYDWTKQCGRFVMSGSGPGKPRQFCVGRSCRKLDSDYNKRRVLLELTEREFRMRLEREQKEKLKRLGWVVD